MTGTQQEIAPNLPALLVRIPVDHAFLKRSCPEFRWSSPSSQLSSFNCCQGVRTRTKPTRSDIWAFLLEWQIVCAASPFIIKMRYLGRSKAIWVEIIVGFVGQGESVNRRTSALLKNCTKMSSLGKNQTSTKWNILTTNPHTMITLSASSGHTLLMHFQRKGFSKCRFYGFDFKCKSFPDVSGWVSSLDVFWQARGGVAGGTWEISSSLFCNSVFVFVFEFLYW